MPLERRTYTDPASGVTVTQLTDYKGHSHHFYFTNPGWYDHGRRLLISSDRNNRTNLFGVDLVSGAIEQLTDLEPVPPPRETEFFKACVNPLRDEVYFWHDTRLLALDLVSRQTRMLYEADPAFVVHMTNCSADGAQLYFGMYEDLSSRFRVDLQRGYIGFRETWEAHPLSRVVGVATDGSSSRVVFEERCWIGHVNTSPTDPRCLTFCHEGPWDCVDHRIWGLDTLSGRVWKIRPTTGREVVGHEYWYADGMRLGYHGRNADGKPMLGHIRSDGSAAHETAFPGQTGHIHSHDERLIVGDGGNVIRLWELRDGEYLGPRLLCRHDSAMRIQQTHPHPRISPDGTYVVFSSDRTGYGNVYTVPLRPAETLPPTDT